MENVGILFEFIAFRSNIYFVDILKHLQFFIVFFFLTFLGFCFSWKRIYLFIYFRKGHSLSLLFLFLIIWVDLNNLLEFWEGIHTHELFGYYNTWPCFVFKLLTRILLIRLAPIIFMNYDTRSFS